MKLLLIPAIFTALVISIAACKSSTGPAAFCDTACITDTIRFSSDHPLHPYIQISARDCKPDQIIRSHDEMPILHTDFGFSSVHVNKDYIRCIFSDTSYAYILFNDCITGRGYQIRMPFSKSGTISKRSSGINNLDPKFEVADNMIAYTDRGNIYVEEVSTGKKAMMTFGKGLDIDYDAIHEFIDTVNVTRERIWVKVKIDDKWTELQKKISLE